MFGFNVNRPTSLDAIEGAIGSYGTPEAAVADFDSNAPGGRDYLTSQYQKLTGDWFADPFKDIFKTRTDDMVSAAMNGSSVATGSNTGMKLLSLPKPMAPGPVQADPTVAAANARHTMPMPAPTKPDGSLLLSPRGTREVSNSLLTGMLQSQGREYQMASKDLEIPVPTANNYLQVLEKRANLTGTANEFKEIWRNNPKAFMSPADENDPRFARTQAGKAIGMDIHPLAYDDTFQQLARRDPGKAASLYRAVTNRDYDTDVKAKSQLLVEQRDARKKIIEGIKHLEADPVTGELYKVVDRHDALTGTTKQERLPVSPLEKAAVDAEGGAKRIYGVDLPGRGGLPKLPGMNDEELVQYRAKTQQLMKEKGLDVKGASALAHRMMYQEQQTRNMPPAPPQRPGIQKAVEALSDMQISGANIPLRLLNELLTKTGHDLGTNSSEPIPLIPHPNWDTMAENDVPIMDILREGINNFRQLPAGRTYGNTPILPPPPPPRRRQLATTY